MAWENLKTFVQEHADVRDVAESVLSAWVEHLWPVDQRPAQFAQRMRDLTDDNTYMERLLAEGGWTQQGAE